ncbi:MAG: DUF5017 domain-containing protein [Bacteroidia bacterium]|nr:DUF5017 domain-containing protein [Bacteroidia bacterium]
MKYLYITLAIFIITSCGKDERFDQPIITFYPNLAMMVEEDDKQTISIRLETSRILDAPAQVIIEVVNGDFLTTTPAITSGLLTLDMSAGSNEAFFTVSAGDDVLPTSYEAIFRIQSVTGALADIGNGSFSLFVMDTDQEAIFEDDFQSQNLSKWTTYDAGGSNNWRIDDFSGNYYADVSNFQNTGVGDDWLISPSINFDNYVGEMVSFETLTAFNDANVLEVVILKDYNGGDPALAEKVVLSPALDPHRGGGFGDFTPSGLIDLSQIQGNGSLAFHFDAIDETDGARWQVDNVVISGVNISGSSGTGGGGSMNGLSLPISENFEGCQDDFVTPDGFIEVFGDGSKTDRGWGCRQEGVDGSRAVRASAFGGDDGFDDAWLIFDNPILLSSVSSAYLQVDVKSRFDGDGNLTLLWSSDYSGGANPTSASWTEVNQFESDLPAKGSDTYKNIITNLSAAVGNDIYMAFRWKDGTSSNSASFEIDNIGITASEPSGSGGGGGGTGGGTSIYLEDFTDCENTSMARISVSGDQTWSCTGFGRSGDGMRMSGFSGGSNENEDWLITPAVDLSGLSSASLEFFSDVGFNGPAIDVLISTDYDGSDPAVANWTTLSPALDTDTGNDTWTSSGILNLDSYVNSAIFIAFKYTSTTDASARWTIDDIQISGN